MARNERHIVPNEQGGWDVVKPGGSRASSHHDTQAAAEGRAKEILGGEAVIHGRDGDVKPTQGLAAIGTLAAESFEEAVGSRATRYRNRARVRELGLVLVDGSLEEVEVDLHDALEGVLDSGCWG